MTIIRYNADNPDHVRILRNQKQDPTASEVLPRRSRYSELSALRMGLMPLEAYPEMLVPRSEWKERIEAAHRDKTFPMYHQRRTWAPEGFKSYQNGSRWCWTWSGTGWYLTIRSCEDKPTIMIPPVAQTKWVNYSNQGWYLDGFIEKARNDGFCPMPEGETFNSLNNSRAFWSQYDGERKNYRLDAVLDCNNRAGDEVMVQHYLSGLLLCGRPIYIAFNWWGHALFIVGVRWDDNAYLNIIPIIQNSHGEDDWIELEGKQSVPDEGYIGVSTVPVELAGGKTYLFSPSTRLFLPSSAA